MEFKHTWTGNWKNAFHGLRHPLESYSRSDSIFGISECYGDETLDLEDIWLQKKNPELYNQYHSDNWLKNTENEYIYACEEIGKWLWKNGVIHGDDTTDCFEYAFLGPNDMDLAQRMIKAGSPNDKFLRQIFVSVDITAPLYWFKEMDTYKVATVANSTSTMHKLASTPITIDCFEMDDYNELTFEKSDQSEVTDFGKENGFNAHWHLETERDRMIKWLEDLRLKYLETKDIRYWKELIRWLPESWLQTRTFTCNYAVLRNIIHWRKGHKLKYEWDSFIKWCQSLPYSQELLFYANGYENEYKLHDLLSSK